MTVSNFKENNNNKNNNNGLNLSLNNSEDDCEVNLKTEKISGMATNTKCKSSHSIDAILGLRAAAAAAVQNQAAVASIVAQGRALGNNCFSQNGKILD